MRQPFVSTQDLIRENEVGASSQPTFLITERMGDERVYDNKKKIGRPATGVGQMIGVRLQRDQLQAVDQWAENEPDKPSRPEAIRRLVKKALGGD